MTQPRITTGVIPKARKLALAGEHLTQMRADLTREAAALETRWAANRARNSGRN